MANITPIQPDKEVKKQVRWFRTDVDFENSFKFWFALQWQNHYILLFLAGLVPTILEICNMEWVAGTIAENFSVGIMGGIFTVMGLLIPIAITAIVSYKVFWQYFNDLKHGRSR